MIRPGVIAVIGLAAAAAAAALALSLDRDDSDDTASLPNAAVFGPPSPDEAKGPAVTVARFGPTGDMMIAGRAIPEAQVVVRKTNLAGEVTEIGRIIADSRSEWVFVPDGPLAPGAWRIGVWSDRTAGPVSVVVAVPDGDPGALVALETPSNGPSRILKGGEDTPRPSILVVDRDENGRMAMAGRADPNAILHLYADNRFIGRTVADDHGDWQAAARTSKTGGRSLRVDEVDAKGKVSGRRQRTWNGAVQDGLPVSASGFGGVARDDAWQVVRRGPDGAAIMTTIYRADKAGLADPDLIYPGQVFSAGKD